MTDKAIVEAVARTISAVAWQDLQSMGTIGRGRTETSDFWLKFRSHAQAAITAYEAAKEATIQKAADELVHVEEFTYLDGDVELDHIQDWYMN